MIRGFIESTIVVCACLFFSWMALGFVGTIWSFLFAILHSAWCLAIGWYGLFAMGGPYPFLAIALLLAVIGVVSLIALRFRLNKGSI